MPDVLKPVTLKNGAEEAEEVVKAMMFVLSELMKQNPIAFYELCELCRNPQHQLWGNTREVLESRIVMEPDGQPHEKLRNIILSAIEGDGMNMKLVSPIAGNSL